MGDRDSERVRRIGTGNAGARQQPLDHGMDLVLVGAAGADHRFLDEPRRIFSDFEPGRRRCEQDHAACLAELEGRLRILVDENLLDCSTRGPEALEDVDQRPVQGYQPFRERVRGPGPDLAVADVAQTIALRIDYAPAGAAKPGIEADQDQAIFSITSSGTS